MSVNKGSEFVPTGQLGSQEAPGTHGSLLPGASGQRADGCYCRLSLDTLWASQFTLVFQLSRSASLNFTRKCFSASSSVFPSASESCGRTSRGH